MICLGICSLVFGGWNVGFRVFDFVDFGMEFGVLNLGFGIRKFGSSSYGFCHGLCKLVFAFGILEFGFSSLVFWV